MFICVLILVQLAKLALLPKEKIIISCEITPICVYNRTQRVLYLQHRGHYCKHFCAKLCCSHQPCYPYVNSVIETSSGVDMIKTQNKMKCLEKLELREE